MPDNFFPYAGGALIADEHLDPRLNHQHARTRSALKPRENAILRRAHGPRLYARQSPGSSPHGPIVCGLSISRNCINLPYQ